MKGIWTYHALLPEVENRARMSLGEGHTPLVKSRFIGPSLGLNNLYFKLENLNPTGSYKDRFAAMALSRFVQQGIKVCLATSSGNTGAALAAYCAAAQLPCIMAVVDGAPEGKLQQMRLYGAATLMVKDFGKRPEVTEQVMTMLGRLAEEQQTSVQISAYCFCPEAMAGVQTIAYEIAAAFDGGTQVFVPAGGGGLTLAVARGFERWQRQYGSAGHHVVHCVQPMGNDTIVSALAGGEMHPTAVPQSTTAISGLQVPNVLDGFEVIAACRRSGGKGFDVQDEQVWECQDWLAKKEGIFCEPAGAVALAGVRRALAAGALDPDRPIVCLITGHGFKDVQRASVMASTSANAYLANEKELKNYIIQLIKK